VHRILIAIEDFNELLFCETILKKVGFDTQSSQTDLSISEGILSFNPDLLIMTATGTRVNGVSYLSKLKSKNKNLPVVLVGQRSRLNMSDKQIKALLEPPLSPRILIEVLSNLFDLDENALLTKYEKSSEYRDQKEKKSSIHVTSKDTEVSLRLFVEKNKQSPEKIKERSNRYKKIATATELPPFIGMEKALIQDQVKDFRQTQTDPETQRIDEERKMFAIELARRFKRASP
jgi:DNA-binding response OmpR family regulator